MEAGQLYNKADLMRSSRNFISIFIKGSAVSSLSDAAGKMVTLLLLPVFTVYLSPEDFGTVSLVLIVSSFLSLFYNPGLTSATMRLYHDTNSEEERKELIGSANVFYIYFPLIISIALIILGHLFFDKLFSNFKFYPYGILAILLALFSQTRNIWVTLNMLKYKVKSTALTTLISLIIGAAASLILVATFKMGALGRVLGMFPQVLFIWIIALISVRIYSQGLWSYSSLKSQLKVGFPLIGAIWATSLMPILDRFIIEKMVDLHSVGLYAFAFQIAQVPSFLVMGVRQIWNPIYYDNMNKGNYQIIKKLSNIYIFILASLCICLLLFSKEIVNLFIDSKYYEAIPLISILVFAIYFSGLLLLPNSALSYEKRFFNTSQNAIVAVVINVLLNFLLLPKYGITGSAIASVIAYFAYFVLGMISSYLTAKKFMSAKVIIITPLLLLVCLILSLFSNTTSGVAIICVKVAVLICSLLMLSKLTDLHLSQVKNLKSLISK